MHVMVIPADRGGCGYLRLIWPGQAVSLVRPDWTVSIVHPERVQAGFLDGKFVGVKGFPDPLPDVLVMQRVGTPGQFEVLKWASQNGIAVVLDFDDAMWAIDRENMAWAAWNIASGPKAQHWRYCDDAAKIADLVTVTTDHLARRYGRHGRVDVINNYVPQAATDLPMQENEVFTAGWAGFTQTHPGDVRVSRPAAEAVLAAGGRLRVIADAPGAAREWGLDPSQVDSVPPQRLGPDYFGSLSALDLMLIGLRDTPFNRAKSTLKAIEAGAAGVPSIAPDNPPHRALARAGFPITLVQSDAEWAEQAARYARMPADARQAHRLAVRAATRACWTIEDNAEHWAQAWERAHRRKHG